MFSLENPEFLLQNWPNLKVFTEQLYAMLKKQKVSAAPSDEAQIELRNPSTETSAFPPRPGVSESPTPNPVQTQRKSKAKAETFKIQDLVSQVVPQVVNQSDSQASRADRTQVKPGPARPSDAGTTASSSSSFAFSSPSFAQPAIDARLPRRAADEPKIDKLPESIFNPPPPNPLSPPMPSVGGGTTLLIGYVSTTIVGSGGTGGMSGNVDIYDNGPPGKLAGDKPSSTVPVTFQGVNSNETIVEGTWIFNIYTLSDPNGNPLYYTTLPVWVQ